MLREKRQSLALQPRKLHHHPETFAVGKIEGHNFIPGDAVEIAIGTEAKPARPAKSGQVFGTKNAHKMSVRGVVLTDRRHGIGRSKWILARYDDVVIGRDRQVERTEFRVTHKPRRHVVIGSEGDNSVVARARRADPRAQKQSAVATESKSARKRHDSRARKCAPGASRVRGNAVIVRALRKPT